MLADEQQHLLRQCCCEFGQLHIARKSSGTADDLQEVQVSPYIHCAPHSQTYNNAYGMAISAHRIF